MGFLRTATIISGLLASTAMVSAQVGGLICDSVSWSTGFGFNSTGNTVQFANQTNTAGFGSTYYWSFGDGQYSTANSPQHTYQQPGTYLACLQAAIGINSGADSCFQFHCDTIEILSGGIACDTSAFVYFVGSGSGNGQFFFNGTGSINYSGYLWDLGDGTTTQTTSAALSYTYTQPGTYTVCLNAWYFLPNNDSCLVSHCDTVVVSQVGSSCDPNAFVSLVPSSLGNTVYQFNLTGNQQFLGYSWTYGDGGLAYSTSPVNVHTYPASGNYTACVDAWYYSTMNDTCWVSSCATVVVGGTSPCDSTSFIQIAASNTSANNYSFTVSGNQFFAGYDWTFGDGNSTYTGLPWTQHGYPSTGTYNACVTGWYFNATNDTCWVSDCITINPGAGNLICDSVAWSVDFSTSIFGQAVQFVNQSNTAGYAATYVLDFGDGQQSSSPSTVHTYQQSGTYVACLYGSIGINNGMDSCFMVQCDTIVVGNGQSQCDSTAFVYFVPTISANGLVFFNGTGSMQFDWYQWTFGDGTSAPSTSPFISHIYNQSGTYTACLDAYYYLPNGDTCIVSYCDSVVVSLTSSPCDSTAFVNIFPSTVSGNLVVFDATSNQNLIFYSWDFGDGNVYTGGPVMTYQYTQPGTYTVCLNAWYNVTPGDSCLVTDCYTVTIGGGNTICDSLNWSADFFPNVSGQFVQFFNQTNTLGYNATYVWDFGDGQTSALQSPAHTYQSPGIYGPCLSVWIGINNGMDSCFQVHCDTVVIGGSSSPCDSTAYVQINPAALGNNLVSFGISGNQFFGGYFWNFGDGTTGTSAFPWQQHQYSFTGTYNVCVDAWYLTATLDTCWVSSCTSVFADPFVACDSLAVINVSATTTSGNLVVLNATGNQNYVGYAWDFGNGTTSYGSNVVTYQYPQPGVYTACVQAWYLTVNNDSCFVSDCISINIGGLGSPCDSTAYVNMGMQSIGSLGYNFFATGNQNFVWFEWDFGDGASNGSGNGLVNHTYNNTGNYLACVEAAYMMNSVDTCWVFACDTIVVSANGVDEYSFGSTISAYPNPVTDIVSLDLQDLSGLVVIDMVDVQGRTIRSYQKQSGVIVQLPMNDLASGVYLLKIGQSDKQTVVRLLKQ
jgi:PKD repeat protein